MTRIELKIAGWLAMTSAFSTVPLTYFAYRLDQNPNSGAQLSHVGIELTGAVLFLAVALYLKKMLRSVFSFRAVDKTIVCMIITNCVSCFLSLISFTVPQLRDTFDMVSIILMIVQGVLQIQLGYTFLKFPYHLDGMQRPFSYLNMVTGICLASVRLVVVGVLASAISDLMLGTIFFYVSRAATEQNDSKPVA